MQIHNTFTATKYVNILATRIQIPVMAQDRKCGIILILKMPLTVSSLVAKCTKVVFPLRHQSQLIVATKAFLVRFPLAECLRFVAVYNYWPVPLHFMLFEESPQPKTGTYIR